MVATVIHHIYTLIGPGAHDHNMVICAVIMIYNQTFVTLNPLPVISIFDQEAMLT